MLAIKNLWRKGIGGGDGYRPQERDEHMVACDTLMCELDFHIKELERFRQDQESEERRLKSGVDYSWLMESNPKIYEMPQMERLELEELCYKVSGSECTQIIALFRDAVSHDPKVEDIPYIMRSCVRKTLDERPCQESLVQWVARRTNSLANLTALRLKTTTKVVPSFEEPEDIEMQNNLDQEKSRTMSMPDFSVSDVNEGSSYTV